MKRGDLGDGEPTNPAFEIDVILVGFSTRPRFRDFVAGRSAAAMVVVVVVGCKKLVAAISPCSDAMRCGTPCSDLYLFDIKVHQYRDPLFPLQISSSQRSVV